MEINNGNFLNLNLHNSENKWRFFEIFYGFYYFNGIVPIETIFFKLKGLVLNHWNLYRQKL